MATSITDNLSTTRRREILSPALLMEGIISTIFLADQMKVALLAA